jgi:hypothetical protein
VKAYLVLITWPNGKEGLLFPRPGNVAVAATPEQGESDFKKAHHDLLEYAEQAGGVGPSLRNRFTSLKGTTIRLIEFERGPVLKEFKL